MPSLLPFEVREAIVQVCGSAFWYKGPLRAFLLSCDVPAELFDRYADESKYKIARHLLAELDSHTNGETIQRRIVTELCRLRRVPDEGVPDKDAALTALRWLKELAVAQRLVFEQEQSASEARVQEARRKQAAVAARAAKMQELHRKFLDMVTRSDDPQARGYGLEDLLAELFAVHEIPYRRPYRTEGEQIDGHFAFGGFDYLVEARWRRESPNKADLGAFKMKIDGKISSTRGLFVSIHPFRPGLVLEFTRGQTSNMILIDGADLVLVLEGHVSLTDALEMKIAKAAQEGIVFFPLRDASRRV